MKLLSLLYVAPVAAQFGNLFEQIFQQQHQQQHQQHQAQPQDGNRVENLYYQVPCDKYLCEDTLTCVNSMVDCPCPFENSQLKCILPDNSRYVCISKPSNDEGPGCDFVNQAWEGQV